MQAFIISSRKYGEQIVLMDNSDVLLFKKYNWSLQYNPHVDNFYLITKQDGKTFRFHRLVMGADKNEYIDHVNHNTLDNRKTNLRKCSNTQNMQNSSIYRMNKTSKYKGVHFRKDCNKYRASIRVNKKLFNLGHFTEEKDAAISYNIAAKKYFGKYALINKI